MIVSADNIGIKRGAPTVSVVIPAYNCSQYIRQTLDSVKSQTLTNYEVIVVNDGSDDTDELERILCSHALPVIYVVQENKGVSAARNAAIKIARGEFYAQLDADDQWAPEYLDVQLQVLQDSDAAVVYPNAKIISNNSNVELEFMEVSPSEGEVSFDTLIQQKCVVMTSVTARMSAIKQVGMFDEGLRSCEDFDLWLRIVKNGGRIAYHRQPLVLYRRHENSLSSDRVWMIQHLLAVLEKSATTFTLSPSEHEVLNKQIIHNRALLYLFAGKRALTLGQVAKGLKRLEKANTQLRSPKLTLVVFLLRHAPIVVTWTLWARGRLLKTYSKNQLMGFDQPHTISRKESSGNNSSELPL